MSNFETEIGILKSETKNLVKTLDEHIQDQKNDFTRIREDFRLVFKKLDDFIKCADKKYADAEQFRFWRNLLIAGIFLSTSVGVVGILIDKWLHP